MTTGNYEVSWNELGDIEEGRPSLGGSTSVIVYRLFQFSLRHVLEERFGIEQTDALLRRAGRLAGKEFAATQLDRSQGVEDYLSEVVEKMETLKIGVLRAEKVDLQSMEFMLTVSEDLDCSGTPVIGRPICSFDEGFIAGVFERFAGREFDVREIDCWATGAKTCRFTVRPA
ncbi:MAG: 4-vinyl reductase [Methanomassiliicoccus sp.]|nr:4-vinyl reductase [Methanomassiliicoccus sp.]